ncbi:MAG: hypothetical protein MRY83_07935 [Flavobacteriales bacterium]|nr:hypothetical protein [Flavobacteriales bacterium]
MQPGSEKQNLENKIPCVNCGAELRYLPGTSVLKCDYCGTQNEIIQEDTEIIENDYLEALSKLEDVSQKAFEDFVVCHSCNGQTQFDPEVITNECSFCGASLSIDDQITLEEFRPKYLLPFNIDNQGAKRSFKDWISGKFWAPNTLRKYAKSNKIRGIYIPYWTYDAQTYTTYTGQRGEHYYDTERYTAFENGKSVRKTRRVQKTRWYPASGSIDQFFDDVLVRASFTIPPELGGKRESWDIQHLVPYDIKYLKGFIAERSQLPLKDGFEQAKRIMNNAIRSAIRRDIGGDEQRIHSMSSDYSELMFKQVLLPIWLSTYKFNEKIYHFYVNGRSGHVQGTYPVDKVKVIIAIVLGLLLIAAIVFGTMLYQGKI